jgi:hypothetical protein
MAERSISISRRRFLFAAGAGGAGAAVAARFPAGKAAAVSGTQGKQPWRYRVTEHIGKYYRTAKF